MRLRWIITPFTFIMLAIIFLMVFTRIIPESIGIVCFILNFWGYVACTGISKIEEKVV